MRIVLLILATVTCGCGGWDAASPRSQVVNSADPMVAEAKKKATEIDQANRAAKAKVGLFKLREQ